MSLRQSQLPPLRTASAACHDVSLTLASTATQGSASSPIVASMAEAVNDDKVGVSFVPSSLIRGFAAAAVGATLTLAVWLQRETVGSALAEIRGLSVLAVVGLLALTVYERWSRGDIVRRLLGDPVRIGRAVTIHDVGTAVSKGVPLRRRAWYCDAVVDQPQQWRAPADICGDVDRLRHRYHLLRLGCSQCSPYCSTSPQRPATTTDIAAALA